MAKAKKSNIIDKILSIEGKKLWLGALAVSVLYLTNPTMGFIEFIPDNTFLVGNLDEVGATILMLHAGKKVWS